MNATLSFHDQKQQALTRRATKLIEWLRRPEYAVYESPDTTIHLIKLINLIIWALERSIPEGDWEPFKEKLLNVRFLAQDSFETEEAAIITYKECLVEIEDVLWQYMEVVKSLIFTK